MSFFKTVAPLVVCLNLANARMDAAASVDALMEIGHWKRAREIVDAKLRANSNDAQAYAWSSKIKSSFGDNEGSYSAAERAVALNPKNPDFHGQLAEACAMLAETTNPLRGFSLVRRMKKEIEAALALNPKHVDTLLVKMMFSWKAPALAGGDKKAARRIADQIASIAPAWGYLAHARLLQDQGVDAETEGWLKKAVQADPAFYRARVALARFYCCTSVSKRPDLAEKAARDAIAVDPTGEGAYSILARVYAMQQRWTELDETVAHAATAVPDDFGSLYAASKALLEVGKDFRRAESYLNRYLSQAAEGRQPTHVEARRLLATLRQKEGRKSD